jgi:hypothetical protein
MSFLRSILARERKKSIHRSSRRNDEVVNDAIHCFNIMKEYSLWVFIVFMNTFISSNLIITIFVILYFCFLVHSDQTGELYHYLMSKYNKHVRPVKNNSDIVNVKLGLKLIQLADVVCIDSISILNRLTEFLYFCQDEKNQIMQTHVYVLHVSRSEDIFSKIIDEYLGMARF